MLITADAQTVKDIDGNAYPYITIGNQTWMAENLRTTKFRNGDKIRTTPSLSSDIRAENLPQFQWPSGGKESSVEIYGRLYTWYTVSDNRGICPVGWHVSSEAEWSALIAFLGGESIACAKIKEAENVHWIKYDSGTNETGFNAVPAGIRISNGSFEDVGYVARWWSSTEINTHLTWCISLTHDENFIHKYAYLKRNGLSVRCIKNQ